MMSHNPHVMVVDANALGMIAVIRSLGRAGYRPHAVSSRADALGFKSRFAYKHSPHPDYASPDLVPWLRDYIAANSIGAIVCGEAFLHAIHEHYAEFESLIPDSVPAAVRQLCLSKARVWNHLAMDPATRKHLPESGVFDSQESIDSFTSADAEHAIFYLKMDKECRRVGSAVTRVARLNGVAAVREAAGMAIQDYSALFWQRHVSGLQVGVSLWRHNGEILAENMVLGRHLYPYHAGNMSLRETWWHEGVLADAKTKLAAVDWNGVAMMEYIWDPETDQFWFIELNPRYWGYLHLDLSCDKDFPKWQLDAHFGQITTSLGPPVTSRTMRYAPGEVLHVISRCLAPTVSVMQKFESLIRFVLLSANPAVKADLWFRGDRWMYFHGWLRFIREIPSRAAKVSNRAA